MKSSKIVQSCFVFFLFILLSSHVYAIDMEIGINISNIGINDDGTFNSKVPDFGFDIKVSGAFTEMVSATFTLQRTPFIGNLLKPRLNFSTRNIFFEIGPSISVLNNGTGSTNKGLVSPIQPGFGIGMGVNLDNGFFALFDIDFSLATGKKGSAVFINNGRFEIGARLGQTMFSLSVDQYTRSYSKDTQEMLSSLTDIGLNFEVFSKGSPFRFPFTCVFRILHHDGSQSFTLGAISLSAGLTHHIFYDMAWYTLVEVSLMSFPMINTAATFPTFYKIRSGVRFTL